MSDFMIAALGASAGGIQALQAFFEATSPKSGVAYVVILHLSPNHDSELAQVLQRATAMPVVQVTKKTLLEPNYVYVIPPDKHLTMEDGSLIVTPNVELAERRAPVDIFFRSLAESHGPRAVCVVLSGTGANGSMGLKRVKERGGAAFVQDPREATFNEMPRNAIATGFVDDVLGVADIPGRIYTYRDTLSDAHIEEEPERRMEEDQQALREIFTQLRLRTGHDFSNYKRATLMRRIERRLAIRAMGALPAYATFSHEHPEETQALLKDLLISVTNFFRDKTPFTALEEEILPAIFENKTAEDQVRVWVAGCATGEEAYTIAMLCAERTLGLMDTPKVQIFATDIDEAAIAHAREGFYTLNDAADVSAERLSRFFTREGEGYRIRREIRETILFAHHNFLKDPFFSRIDLVSCRNVLIYLNRPAQERVMETFHFALKRGGFMLLGTSESVDIASDLFKPFNKEQHIYQPRTTTSLRPFVVPESVPLLKLPAHIAEHVIAPAKQAAIQTTQQGELHLQLLEQYMPPSLVVDAAFNIVHISPSAGRYLQMSGEPTQEVLKLILDELRSELRNGLYQAAQKGMPVNSVVISVRTREGSEEIRLHVRPVTSEGTETKGYLLVVFEPMPGNSPSVETVSLTTDESAARRLEEELSRLRAQLRASNEQHEFQAEELKSGNEELQAMNEELRSATEELETSKEELQSINEELGTVNQELKVKVEEATMVSNNLQNLINSTDIGTIFLDRSMRVVLFTPAVRSVFNLIPADYGRPLADIKGRLLEDTVLEDAALVLERLQVIEREARTADGLTYLIRMAPYRTEDDRIQGVVISLLDITQRKRADEALRVSEERFRTLSDTAPALIWQNDAKGENLFINQHFLDFTGKSLAQIKGQGWHTLIHPDDVESYVASYLEAVRTQSSWQNRNRIRRYDDAWRWFENYARPLFDGSGQFIGHVGVSTDITDNVLAEQTLRASEGRQAFLLKLSDLLRPLKNPVRMQEAAMKFLAEALGVMRATYIEVDADGDRYKLTALYEKDAPPMPDRGRISDLPAVQAADYRNGRTLILRETEAEPQPEAFRAIGVRAALAVPLVKAGQLVAIVGVHSASPRDWAVADVQIMEELAERTWAAVERAKTEEALRESEEQLSAFVNATSDVMYETSADWRQLRPFDGKEFVASSDRPNEDWTVGYIPQDERERVWAAINKAIETRSTFELEHRVNRRDGSEGWTYSRATPILNEAGEIIKWFGAASDVTEQKRAEEELRKSEEKFRSLFNSIDEGFCIFELLYDDEGNAVDWIYTTANPAFEQQTGYIHPVGKRISEFQPDLERSWFERFAEVARTGEPVRFVQYTEAMGIWYDVYALRVGVAGDNRVSLLFTDVTESKRAEERQAFLLKLGDVLRAQPDAQSIKDQAVRMLGEHLHADRCYISEVFEQQGYSTVGPEYLRAGIPPMTGMFQLSDYPETMLQLVTQPLIIHDADNDPRFSDLQKTMLAKVPQRALLVAPLRKGPREVVWAIAAAMATPRTWTEPERVLLEEVAERTWGAVERAKAERSLRESKEKFSALFASSPAPFLILQPDAPRFTIIEVNDAYLAATIRRREEVLGRGLFEAFPDNPDDMTVASVSTLRASLERVLASRQPDALPTLKYDIVGPDGMFEERWWSPVNSPVLDENGEVEAIIHNVNDVTVEYRATRALRASEEQLRDVLDSMAEGFALLDSNFTILDVNQETLRLDGRSREELVGNTHWDVFAGSKDLPVGETLMRVVRERIPAALEHEYSWPDGRSLWLDMRVYPTQEDKVAIFWRDINDRKRAEEALRKSEERQSLLLKLGDVLRTITDPADIQQTAMRMLGESLGLSRAYYFSVEHDEDGWVHIITDAYQREPGAPSMVGRHSLKPFGSWMFEDFAHGGVVAVSDVAALSTLTEEQRAIYQSIGVAAFVNVPLLQNGHYSAGIAAHRTTPHVWTPEETGLMREVAARMWTFVQQARAEQALLESEDRLRTLADAVPQIIWSNRADGAAHYFNRRWYEYSGLSFEKSFGLGWQAIVHADDAPASKERWQQALETSTIFDTEYRLRGVDGKYRWFIGRNVPLKDADGTVIGWFGSATDIQDLKEAEEALHVSRQRLRVTMESATDYAIITTDAQGRIGAWSKGAEIIFGYREDEVVGQSTDFIFTPEDRADNVPQKEMEKARDQGRAEDERWHLRRDGSRFYMSGVTSPIYDGQLSGYVKVARDMTGQKAAEEHLRISEERYRVALQSAGMGAWDWNVMEGKVRCNDQYFLLLGMEPEYRLLDTDFFPQFVHPDDLPAVRKELMQAVEETGYCRMDSFRIIRKDGQARWMSAYGRTVAWEGGKSSSMVGVMFDITERKLLEQQKEQFIGIASHELRTPVTSIKAYAELLEGLFTEGGDMHSANLMRKMDVQVDRLTSLIYALLDSTRVTEGKLQLQKTDFAIDALIADTVETMQRIAGSHRIEMELEAKAMLHADQERIRQVLTNLISNAIKYAPGTDRVIVRSVSDDKQVTVCVQDFGIGMDEQTQRQLFEPFFRSLEASSFSGLGLGLFISAGIVRQHGGNMTVQSRKGEGAMFCFTIPFENE